MLLSALSPASALSQAQQSRPAVPVDPTTAIIDAFRTHQVVAVGDAHGNEQGEAFRLGLIRDPRFATSVDDILVEFGNARYQDLMDRFVRGDDVPEDRLRRVWQDTTQPQASAWAMPKVFQVVREVNASLPRDRKLRVLLGDPPVDWARIRTPEDWQNWLADPLSDRDRYAADLIQREVVAKRRRALAIYGAGHFFRRNVGHSIVSLLEAENRARVFTIWTNAAADLRTLQPGVESWPVPSLAIVRETVLGKTDFASYFAPGTPLPDAWRVPMEEQFDAVLQLGPPTAITFAQPVRWPCDAPAFVERLRRMALSPLMRGQVDRLKQNCTAETAQSKPSTTNTQAPWVESLWVFATFASWNQIDDLLRRLEALRSAAGSA